MAIAGRGDCGYVYRDPERFPGVVDSATFRLWAQGRLEAVREGVESFRPQRRRSTWISATCSIPWDELGTAVRLAVELERESPGQW